METKPIISMTTDEKVIYLRKNHPTKVPIKVVAEMLDATEVYVRCGLIDKSLPFGSAVMGSGGRWSFNIPADRFIMYLVGADIVRVTQDNLLENLRQAFDDWLTKTKAAANQAI